MGNIIKGLFTDPNEEEAKQILEYGFAIEKRRLFKTDGFDVTMILWNMIVMMLYIPYFGLVTLNLVFTNDYLKTSDYNCYSEHLYAGLGSTWTNVLFPDWWLYLTDTFFIIVPAFEMFILIESYMYPGVDFTSENNWFLAIAAVIKTITAGWRLYELIFCPFFNFCRSCPGECTSTLNCEPSLTFVYATVYNVFFLVILAIYASIQNAGFYKDFPVDYYEYQRETLILYKFGYVELIRQKEYEEDAEDKKEEEKKEPVKNPTIFGVRLNQKYIPRNIGRVARYYMNRLDSKVDDYMKFINVKTSRYFG